MPVAISDAENSVAVEPVEKFARSVNPGCVPASMTYEVVVSPQIGGDHRNLTEDAVRVAVRPAVAPGPPELHFQV